jgi:hypothetical protein
MEVHGSTGTNPPPPPTPPATGGPLRYLVTGGGLSGTAGAAGTATVASAGGGTFDGTPNNPLVYTASGVTMSHSGAATQFDLFVDSGTAVGNATQVRVSYDLTGDGTWDRLETYTYFATDPVAGWQHYTEAAGLRSSTGALGNLSNGRVRVEVWSAIGAASSSLGIGNQSVLRIPYG